MRHPGVMNPLLSRLALKILAILLCCGILPLFAAGLYLWRHNERTLNERIKDALRASLVDRRTRIDGWFANRQEEATRWSSSFIVFEGLEALLPPDANPARVRKDLSEYLESFLVYYRVYESLFILDREGEVVAGTRREAIEPWEREFLAGAARAELAAEAALPRKEALGRPESTNRALLTPIHRSEVLGRATLLVFYPIQGRSDSTLGYLAGRIDLRELEALLRTTDEGSGMSFWLLDHAGRVQVKDGRLIEPGQGDELGRLLKATPAGVVAEAELPGVGVALYCHGPLAPPYDGALIASVARAKAFGPLDQARSRLLMYALPAALVLLVAFLWAVRDLLRPILLLSEGARRLSAGDLSIYLPVRGRDEIAALTAAFNEMTRRLRDGRREIEEARDELARANQDLRAANRTLETLAITDGLTGLYNHRHFQDTLDREIRRCDREGRPLTLLMIDIDHFKQFNDRWGHTEGDAALRRVAAQIMKTIRASDTAFRYGGEEIAVLLPGCLKEQACEVAEKIRGVVSANPAHRGRTGATLTVSVGVATSPDDGRVARGLVDAADAALYTAKARGRDRVVLAGRETADEPSAGA